MPIHQYKCLGCGHEFQKLLPVGHHPEKCLECSHPKVQKLISAPGVIFKGSGFYRTDSRGTQSAMDVKETKPAPAPKSEKKAEDKKT